MSSASVPSGQNDLDQNSLDQSDLDQNRSSQDEQNLAQQASDCLAALSAAFESGSLSKTPVLIRLQATLTETLADYRASNQQNESLALRLEKRAHLLWLCNQCTYYLSEPVPVKSKRRKDRVLWQMRSVVWALARFRLIVHLRSIFPGRVPKSVEWQDILPGFRLWLRK